MSGRGEEKKERMQKDDATDCSMILRNTFRQGRIGIVARPTVDAERYRYLAHLVTEQKGLAEHCLIARRLRPDPTDNLHHELHSDHQGLLYLDLYLHTSSSSDLGSHSCQLLKSSV